MFRGLALFTLAAVALSLLPTDAAAANEAFLISHQGRLVDRSDVGVAGEHTLKFSLYRTIAPPPAGSSETDDVYWTDSYTVLLVDGIYSMTLGDVSAGLDKKPLTADLFAGNRFLGITVDAGAELTPRLRVSSVPLAAVATSLIGGPVNATRVDVGGKAALDLNGVYVGPTEAFDVGKLQGKQASDFAAAVHGHDALYYPRAEADTLFATKAVLAAWSTQLSTDYYTKTEANEKFATATALANVGSTLSSTYYTRTAAEAAFLSKTTADDLYAPKNGGVPAGTIIFGEKSATETMAAAGYTYVGQQSTGWWVTRAAMPNATSHVTTGATLPDGKILIPGGHAAPTTSCANAYGNVNYMQEFDPAANTWRQRAAMPTPRHSQANVVGPDGKLYVIGGYGCGVSSAVNEVFDNATNTWATKAAVPSGHAHHWGASGVVGNKIYLLAGHNGTGHTANNHVYTPASDTWALLKDAPHVMYGMGFGVIANKIYLAGTYNGSAWSNETWAYDPADDSWTRKADAPFTMLAHGGAAVINGRLHVFGGNEGVYAYTNRHVVYDPVADRWSTAEPVPWTSYGAIGVSAGARGFVFGGWTKPSDGAITTAVEYVESLGLAMFKKN